MRCSEAPDWVFARRVGRRAPRHPRPRLQRRIMSDRQENSSPLWLFTGVAAVWGLYRHPPTEPRAVSIRGHGGTGFWRLSDHEVASAEVLLRCRPIEPACEYRRRVLEIHGSRVTVEVCERSPVDEVTGSLHGVIEAGDTVECQTKPVRSSKNG